MSKKYKRPFFIANGESNLAEFIDTLPKRKVKQTLDDVASIISVSTANKQEMINCGLFDKNQSDKIYVLPNGYNPKNFYPMDKAKARETLGFDLDKFIAIFVGSFSTRKGSKRVSEALNRCEDIWSIFIGSGNEIPSSARCLFIGKVDNSKLHLYLSAADVFVLPTLNEGCCNAIVEALACGLPIVSSDLPFNYDILDKECSILISPESIDEIENALKFLKSNTETCLELSRHALEKARGLNIHYRAEKIIEIMKAYSSSV